MQSGVKGSKNSNTAPSVALSSSPTTNGLGPLFPGLASLSLSLTSEKQKLHVTFNWTINNKTPAKHRDIFRRTLIAKKVWRRQGSNPRPGWKSQKIKHQPRVRTQDLRPDRQTPLLTEVAT